MRLNDGSTHEAFRYANGQREGIPCWCLAKANHPVGREIMPPDLTKE